MVINVVDAYFLTDFIAEDYVDLTLYNISELLTIVCFTNSINLIVLVKSSKQNCYRCHSNG